MTTQVQRSARQTSTASRDTSSSSPAAPSSAPLLSLESSVIRDVRVSLNALLGEIELTVDNLLGLSAGSVLKLNRQMNEPIDLHLNGALVARGELVAVDDNFGVRIVEITSAK